MGTSQRNGVWQKALGQSVDSAFGKVGKSELIPQTPDLLSLDMGIHNIGEQANGEQYRKERDPGNKAECKPHPEG